MVQLIINNNEFCAGQKFKDQIIDILYKHLFVPGTDLEKIYDEMTVKINDPDKKIIKLYPLDGKRISNKLNEQLLQRNGFVYAGHDLPVWRNDPVQAKIKIMVITQDPRRSADEMTANEMYTTSDWISISTPFGLHSLTYRSNKNQGLVHYLFNDLQVELQNYKYNPEDLSIYYTDIYKFRGVAPAKNSNEPKDAKDNLNIKIYIDVLKCEIETYKPNIILLMGNDAQNAWDKISNDLNTDIQPLCTPHPSPTANGKWINDYSKDYPEISSFTADVKRNLILMKLKERLKKLKEDLKDMI